MLPGVLMSKAYAMLCNFAAGIDTHVITPSGHSKSATIEPVATMHCKTMREQFSTAASVHKCCSWQHVAHNRVVSSVVVAWSNSPGQAANTRTTWQWRLARDRMHAESEGGPLAPLLPVHISTAAICCS